MRRSVGLLLGLLGCLGPLPEVDEPCAVWDQTGLFRYTTQVDGRTRRALVYIPPRSRGPRDLVVVLHGAGSDPASTDEVSRYTDLARQEGFVVALPEGTHPFLRFPAWNAGDCCLSADEERRDVDDVAFLDQLTDELEARTCSDRVLATGFSNGGMLTHRWACSSDRVDVAIPIAGGLVWDGGCRGEPIPLRHYHGADDPIVPLEGLPERGHPPLIPSLAPWVQRNDCTSGDPIETVRTGPMSCDILDCAVATEVCILDGWKHQWPGGANADRLDGVDATADGYAFFLEHAPPREGSTGAGSAATSRRAAH